MSNYEYKVVEYDAEKEESLEETLNAFADDRWKLQEVIDGSNQGNLNLVVKRKKGVNIREFLNNWESPFFKIQTDNTYIFRAIIGAKYLKKDLLNVNKISWIKEIIERLDLKHSRLPFISPKRWKNGLIFYNDYDLSKLLIKSKTSIENLSPRKYILTHNKGLVEYKRLYAPTKHNDNEKNILNIDDLKYLIDIINFTHELLEEKQYKSDIYIKIQFLADKLYLPNIKRTGINRYHPPISEFPLEIEKEFKKEQIKDSLDCAKKLADKIWYAYGQNGSPVFEED